jgi:hypothetical protein
VAALLKVAYDRAENSFVRLRVDAASAKDWDWAGFGAELGALRPPLEQLSRQLAARHWRHLVDP